MNGNEWWYQPTQLAHTAETQKNGEMEQLAAEATGQTASITALLDKIDLGDVATILKRYPSTDAWMTANKLYVKDRTEDRRVLTHSTLNRKSLAVPDEALHVLDALLARDWTMRRSANYVCELLTCSVFRLFADFDIQDVRRLPEAELFDICQTVSKAARLFFASTPTTMIVWTTQATSTGASSAADSSEHKAVFKFGLHLVWPEVCVNKLMALFVREMALAMLRLRFKAVEKTPGCTTWDQRYDEGVIGLAGGGGGLRMGYNQKMKPCEGCGGNSAASKSCTFCEGKNGGMVPIGRAYEPVWVLNKDSVLDATMTREICRNPTRALELSHVRLGQGTLVSKDFLPPKNCPVPPNITSLLDEHRLTTAAGAAAAGGAAEAKKARKVPEKIKLKTVAEWSALSIRCHEELEAIKKKFGNKRTMVEKTSPLIAILQAEIRRFNPHYAQIEVAAVFTNAAQTYHVCKVRGIGSNFCLNKDDNHKNAQVIFYVNHKGEMSQRCLSSKPVLRKYGGCKCSEFASPEKTMSPLAVEAVVKKKKRNALEGNRTLTETLECRKFVQSVLESSEKLVADRRRETEEDHGMPLLRLCADVAVQDVVGQGGGDMGWQADDVSSSSASSLADGKEEEKYPMVKTPSALATTLPDRFLRHAATAHALNGARLKQTSVEDQLRRRRELAKVADCVFDAVTDLERLGDIKRPASMTLGEDDDVATMKTPGQLAREAEEEAAGAERKRVLALRATGVHVAEIQVPIAQTKDALLTASGGGGSGGGRPMTLFRTEYIAMPADKAAAVQEAVHLVAGVHKKRSAGSAGERSVKSKAGESTKTPAKRRRLKKS